jgi:hypothetical protein
MGIVEAKSARAEIPERQLRRDNLVQKQLELSLRYTRLWLRTGHLEFKHIATREANVAERMMRGY